jgi:hypothetical protein
MNNLQLMQPNLNSDEQARGGGGRKVLSLKKLDESTQSEKFHKRGNPKRLVCSDWRCLWSGLETEALQGINPFKPSCILLACPDCQEQTLCTCCDEPECRCEATCGTPTDSGYRLTCHKHRPIESESLANPRLAKALEWCHKRKLERELASCRSRSQVSCHSNR